MTELCDALSELRQENNLTLEEFGRTFGVTKQTVSRWEKGQREPNLTILVKIADFYGVSTDYLLGRTWAREMYRD